MIPTGDAWHKTRTLSQAHHRLAMCQTAFADLPNVVIDDIEIQRPGPSYTVDTLAALRAQYSQAVFFLVLGWDQAAQFHQWHQHNQILKWATLAIAKRYLSSNHQADNTEWHNLAHTPLDMPAMQISATDIRSRCRSGDDLTAYLKPDVIQYIQNNHLYLEQHD